MFEAQTLVMITSGKRAFGLDPLVPGLKARSRRPKFASRSGGFSPSDSYALPAGAPLFAPPAGDGIWAAAHQRTLLSSFVLLLFLKGFWLCFLQIFWISIFLLVFSVLLGDFQTFKI
jgi:hypothetical protein